ncbi:hypothetical protein J2Z69_001124 [Paenibacillus shirakamiensis]|uniref:Uncharacterized protein n=1 Tax=Paenibacillus shirakamiensis TaxID=1265935 RepID=A0ABS4JEG3_9BACL|nr:hypothetical protein [Paenibacillus shirakamiensis]MBP2000105.1 hypothetical protein [Paenibacillus shirakamiensis]
MKKNRFVALMLLCLALFIVIPLSASAASTAQITGQGQLTVTANFTGSSYAELYITNQNGQEVYDKIFTSGTINATIPNLPYGTYKIIIGGQAISVSNFHYNF